MIDGTERELQETDDNDGSYAISDDWEMKEAYNANESVLHHADTLYITGTHKFRDVVDDTLIPLHLVRNSQRHQQALAALSQANGRVKYLSDTLWEEPSQRSYKKTLSRASSAPNIADFSK